MNAPDLVGQLYNESNLFLTNHVDNIVGLPKFIVGQIIIGLIKWFSWFSLSLTNISS